MKILKAISDFFKAEKIEYWHRDRSIEIVAAEKGLDIDSIKEEIRIIIKKEGSKQYQSSGIDFMPRFLPYGGLSISLNKAGLIIRVY